VGSVDWIHIGQGRAQWWVFLDTVMNLRSSYGTGIYWSSEQVSAS